MKGKKIDSETVGGTSGRSSENRQNRSEEKREKSVSFLQRGALGSRVGVEKGKKLANGKSLR